MKKRLIILPLLGLFLILSLSVVSATTYIMGTIYNQDYSAKVGDANITVACTHDNVIYYRYTTSASSGSQLGDYQVEYPEIGDGACDGGDSVTVTAQKNDLIGSSTEIVVDDAIATLDIAVINVPLTPEFGLIVGSITLLSAVGIFFFVRRQ